MALRAAIFHDWRKTGGVGRFCPLPSSACVRSRRLVFGMLAIGHPSNGKTPGETVKLEVR